MSEWEISDFRFRQTARGGLPPRRSNVLSTRPYFVRIRRQFQSEPVLIQEDISIEAGARKLTTCYLLAMVTLPTDPGCTAENSALDGRLRARARMNEWMNERRFG